MNVTLARRLVGLARRAYAAARSDRAAAWQPRQVDAFTTPAFTGFAASDEHAAYLVFRGTKLHLDSGDLFRRTLQAWLANLDFAQVEEGGGMVHRGYARELDGVSELLLEMARDHAARRQAALRHRPQRRRRAWPRWPPAACTRPAPRCGRRSCSRPRASATGASPRAIPCRCCGSSTGTI